jgi:hypothetical protein
MTFRRDSLRPGLPRNTIADSADSTATCASTQCDYFGIADKEGATVSNGARTDSLAHERREECRGFRGGKRKQRRRECEGTYNLTHTDPTPYWTIVAFVDVFGGCVLRNRIRSHRPAAVEQRAGGWRLAPLICRINVGRAKSTAAAAKPPT